MLGDHRLWGKDLMLDSSARVPLVVVPAQGDDRLRVSFRDDRLVELRDVMPTLLELAGIAVPETVEGQSLLEATRRPYLYGEHYEDIRANRMIREERLKLIYYPVGNHVHLFDLVEDPEEQVNLAENPAYREDRRRLEALLVEEMYGSDEKWVEDGRLVGEPDQPWKPYDRRDLLAQRGLRFL
jgi:arylsulfatase A-like enzyme